MQLSEGRNSYSPASGLAPKGGDPFRIPGKELLLEICDQKLVKVRSEMLYRSAPLALLHSLETYYGYKDFLFDRIAHQKIGVSIMISSSIGIMDYATAVADKEGGEMCILFLISDEE